MTIDVLVCRADGSQVLEQREVADDFFSSAAAEALPEHQSPPA